jgi:hypothetical protein
MAIGDKMIKKIKNNSQEAKTWCGQEIQSGACYQIQAFEEVIWAHNSVLLADIANAVAVVNDGSSDISGVNDAINYLKNQVPVDVVIISQPDICIASQPPFALPTYRTKHDATASSTTVAVNDHAHIDFLLTTELYVSGGSMVIKNTQFGDYVTAEVYDKDSVIPEAYRAALCESWPTVAEYILKEWIKYQGDYTVHEIDTTPLNAKITAGLYLRVTYYAVDAGSAREVLVNYNLTKKL